LTATVVNSAQVSLSWTAQDNATSYTVKRSLTAGGPYTVIQADITGTSFVDVNPVPEVANYYIVTALAGTLESGVSNEASASVPPAAPSRPAVTNKSGEIDLSWGTAAGALTYKVKRAAISGGPYTAIAQVSATSYADTSVVNGSAYYYGAVFNLDAATALIARLGLVSPVGAWLELPQPVELCIRARPQSRERLIFLLNYSAENQTVILHKEIKDALLGAQLSGSLLIEPFGVRILSDSDGAAEHQR
jgi:hypothetical protein